MTAILVTPDLERVLVERQGIVTVPNELATVRCRCPEHQHPARGCAAHWCDGLSVDRIPLEHRNLQLKLSELGTRFIERQRPRGYEPPAMNALKLHGPFPSYEFNTRLADIGSSMLKDAKKKDKNGDEHPEHTLGMVFERDAFSPYSDYLLVGMFLRKAVLTEVIVKES